MGDGETTDAELLEGWRAGDREAGSALFERHFDSLYGFFARKTHGDVGDLVQRTFLGLVEAQDRFRGDASVRTYLFAIARNELYAHWRRGRRDAHLDFAVQSLQDLEPTPSQAAVELQQNRLLLEALRRIPLDLQIAVELHYWEGLTGPEIATVLDVPEGTVRSRLRRGIDLLRDRSRELAESPDALRSTLTDLDRWAAGLRDQVNEA